MPGRTSAYRFMVILAAVTAMQAPAQQRPSTSPPPSGRGVASIDPEAQNKWIDMEGDADGLVIIPIVLNGQRLMAMLDTGAATTTVDAGWATRHGMKYQPYDNVTGMGGTSVQTYIAPIKALQIAGFHQAGGAIQVADLKPLSSTAETPIDAVIGADFLAAYAVTMDFDQRRVRFQPSGSPRPAGSVMPVEPRGKGRGFSTRILIGKRVLSPVMLDTGDDSSLAITKNAWDKSDAPLHMTDIASVGLSGDMILSEIGRVDGVRFGGQVLDKVPVMFEPAPLVPGDEGRLGMKLLDQFNVFLDLGQKVMVLSSRAAAPSPDPVTMSGIQGMWSDAGMRIVHIMKGSPAEALGLRPGERICAIDGTKVTANAPAALKQWSWGPAGKTALLAMCDGRAISITLKEFY